MVVLAEYSSIIDVLATSILTSLKFSKFSKPLCINCSLAHAHPTISWIHLVLRRLILSSDCWFTSQDCRKHLNVINSNSWLTGGSCYFLAGWWGGPDKPDSAASSGGHLFPKHSILWCRNQPVGYPSCPQPSQFYIFDGALSYLSTPPDPVQFFLAI